MVLALGILPCLQRLGCQNAGYFRGENVLWNLRRQFNETRSVKRKLVHYLSRARHNRSAASSREFDAATESQVFRVIVSRGLREKCLCPAHFCAKNTAVGARISRRKFYRRIIPVSASLMILDVLSSAGNQNLATCPPASRNV
ncbi:hypothetical protein TNCV_516861 [Trichonephila clavipes]|nr:hypothetical protein TNCV_516861 [Trichonephila clavipes]